MIKPTNGRVVWVEPAKMADGRSDPSQPYTALITYVHDDRTINVVAFDHAGAWRKHASIPLLQDDDPVPQRALTEEETATLEHDPATVIDRTVTYAKWMPFQVGQAKAQEATSAKP
jgi:hypothetical protein